MNQKAKVIGIIVGVAIVIALGWLVIVRSFLWNNEPGSEGNGEAGNERNGGWLSRGFGSS